MAVNEQGFRIIRNSFRGMDDFTESFSHLYAGSSDDAECYDAVAFMPEFQRLFASPKIVDGVRDALKLGQGHPIYLWAGRLRIDNAGDDRRTYGWHQEKFYGPPEAERGVQVWAPLFQSEKIEVLPGSHQHGVLPQIWHDRSDGAHQVLVEPETVSRFQPKTVSISFGDALMFDSLLVHRSIHHPKGTRFTIIGRFFDPLAPEFCVPKPGMAYRGQSPKEAYRQWRSG